MKTHKISFKAAIIDSHGHTGYLPRDNNNCTPEKILNVVRDSFETTVNGKTETNRVESVILSNLDSLSKKPDGSFIKSELDGTMDLLEICRSHPQLKAAAVCEPSHGDWRSIEELLKKFGDEIYALKFHPMNSSLDASHPNYEPYMRLAQKYGKPCVFHSDNLGSFACPRKIYELARKTPDVPVVLYHMSMAPSGLIFNRPTDEQRAKGVEGWKDSVWNHRERWNRDGINVVKEAVVKKDANLFLEVSWTKPETVAEAIRTVGADRVLFGTDIPLDPCKAGNREWYRENIRLIQKAIRDDKRILNADDVIKKVFYENSRKLFFEEGWAKLLKKAFFRL